MDCTSACKIRHGRWAIREVSPLLALEEKYQWEFSFTLMHNIVGQGAKLTLMSLLLPWEANPRPSHASRVLSETKFRNLHS